MSEITHPQSTQLHWHFLLVSCIHSIDYATIFFSLQHAISYFPLVSFICPLICLLSLVRFLFLKLSLFFLFDDLCSHFLYFFIFIPILISLQHSHCSFLLKSLSVCFICFHSPSSLVHVLEMLFSRETSLKNLSQLFSFDS